MKVMLRVFSDFKHHAPNLLRPDFGERKETLHCPRRSFSVDFHFSIASLLTPLILELQKLCKNIHRGLLAQLVEQRTLNPLVACSSRAEPTKNFYL